MMEPRLIGRRRVAYNSLLATLAVAVVVRYCWHPRLHPRPRRRLHLLPLRRRLRLRPRKRTTRRTISTRPTIRSI
uniref:Putative secreted protein n=1 Tax=Anopheles darlingi TaxID=43151 RepID=A0A2M4DBA6_ANODA